MGQWDPSEPGVVTLPDGRRVRGRGLSRPFSGTDPEFGLYLLAEPPDVPWDARWVRWPDFRLPSSRSDARAAFVAAWGLAASARVEVACAGGRGRTGTALACLAVLSGVPAADAVAWVRSNYDAKAVETPWQRRYVARFR